MRRDTSPHLQKWRSLHAGGGKWSKAMVWRNCFVRILVINRLVELGSPLVTRLVCRPYYVDQQMSDATSPHTTSCMAARGSLWCSQIEARHTFIFGSWDQKYARLSRDSAKARRKKKKSTPISHWLSASGLSLLVGAIAVPLDHESINSCKVWVRLFISKSSN